MTSARQGERQAGVAAGRSRERWAGSTDGGGRKCTRWSLTRGEAGGAAGEAGGAAGGAGGEGQESAYRGSCCWGFMR